MSKRIAFAHIEFVIDFDNYEEAVKYLKDNQGKGWHFEPNNSSGGSMFAPSKYAGEEEWNKWCSEYIYQQDENSWTIVVRKPYRDYNPGW